MAVQHVKTQPQPLEAQRPDLPPALCRVVHQMLAKDPDQRWRSCGELLRELYRIQLEYCPQPTPEEAAAWGADRHGAAERAADAGRAAIGRGDAGRRPAARKGGPAGLAALGIAALFVLGGVTAWCTMRPPVVDAAA